MNDQNHVQVFRPRENSVPRLVSWLLLGLFVVAMPAWGQDPPAPTTTDDGWIEMRDNQAGILIRTKELLLHPRGEPSPALKYRLVADAFDLRPGNAAVHYLKAMGFLEQNHARDRLSKFHAEVRARAEKEDLSLDGLPPYSWLSTAPKDLPVREVQEYLNLMRHQIPMLREASRCDRFDMDRNYREVDDPVFFLIPEIQNMRELARTQSLRCRVAIAAGRIEEAIEVAGQQFAMARHLCQDEFVVSGLVGVAVSGIAWNDMTHLLQHPDTPNLYWALTTLPTTQETLRHSMTMERQMLLQQLKVLREVDETPRPAGYWQDFLSRFAQQIGGLERDLAIANSARDPVILAGAVAAAYPGARSFLIEDQHLPVDKVDAYPTTQVVFLAMKRFYDKWRDEAFKWTYLPVWQSRAKISSADFDKPMREAADKYGWIAQPSLIAFPAVNALRTAEARCEQGIALLRTLEAIRMYAAVHDGQLPPTLESLPVPAPIEPFTGQPIRYELSGDRAIVTGHDLPGLRYRFIVKIAK